MLGAAIVEKHWVKEVVEVKEEVGGITPEPIITAFENTLVLEQPVVLVAVKETDQLPDVLYVTLGVFDVDELGLPFPLKKLHETPPPAFEEVLVKLTVAGAEQKLDVKGVKLGVGKPKTVICVELLVAQPSV
jgi:hypothetical protein